MWDCVLQCNTQCKQYQSSRTPPGQHHFVNPHASRPTLPHLQLYDNAPALPLHEVVEVVGVLSHVPQLAQLEYDNQDPHLAQVGSRGLA